jgi:hypothetical protein
MPEIERRRGKGVGDTLQQVITGLDAQAGGREGAGVMRPLRPRKEITFTRPSGIPAGLCMDRKESGTQEIRNSGRKEDLPKGAIRDQCSLTPMTSCDVTPMTSPYPFVMRHGASVLTFPSSGCSPAQEQDQDAANSGHQRSSRAKRDYHNAAERHGDCAGDETENARQWIAEACEPGA